MTIVSTFYNALTTKLATVWPTAHHIANAFQMEKAASGLLSNGFAIAVGPSSGSSSDQSCQERITRDFLVIRSKVLVATENQTISTSVKSLLEDQFELRKALRIDNTLGGVVSDISFSSDGGIELLPAQSGTGHYHIITSLFTVTYIENLY